LRLKLFTKRSILIPILVKKSLQIINTARLNIREAKLYNHTKRVSWYQAGKYIAFAHEKAVSHNPYNPSK